MPGSEVDIAEEQSNAREALPVLVIAPGLVPGDAARLELFRCLERSTQPLDQVEVTQEPRAFPGVRMLPLKLPAYAHAGLCNFGRRFASGNAFLSPGIALCCAAQSGSCMGFFW